MPHGYHVTGILRAGIKCTVLRIMASIIIRAEGFVQQGLKFDFIELNNNTLRCIVKFIATKQYTVQCTISNVRTVHMYIVHCTVH